MLYLDRVLNRLDYCVLKTEDLERLSDHHQELFKKVHAFEEMVKSMDVEKVKLPKVFTGDYERELERLRHVAKSDFQLVMAHQSLLVAFDDLDPAFRPFMEFVKPR